MKLNELNQSQFNVTEDINIDVSSLYFHYGDKNIYDLLKENVYNHGFLLKKTRTSYKKDHNSYSEDVINQHYYNFYYILINTLTNTEKENLLDLALTTDDLRFAAILISNPQVSLTNEKFEAIFNSKDKYRDPKDANKYRVLKEYLILNKNITLTEEQFFEGLLNFDYGLNNIFSQRDQFVPTHIIDKLIQQEYLNEEILVNILNRKQTMFTEQQIDYCLNGGFLLRLACANNYQFNFTQNQIIQGLNDEGLGEDEDGQEELFYENFNFQGYEVKKAFFENPNIKIPQEYIDLIFSDNNFKYCIEYLLKRNDFCLNDQQINYIIKQKNHVTEQLFEKYILQDKHILDLLYTSQYWKVSLVENYFSREDITLSETIINVLKLQDCKEIQKFLKIKYNT